MPLIRVCVRRRGACGAAKAGGMAAIGIARAHDADLLSAAGANIVVTTFDQVDMAALSGGQLATKR
jgi:hypothetical protein